MTYSQGGLIEALDYNTMLANVNSVYGVGSGNSGYGNANLSTVAQSTTVTAPQWQTLIDTVNKIRTHQTGISPGFTIPTSGTLISWLTGLNQATIDLNGVPARYTTTSWATPVSSTVANSTAWVGTATKEISFTWTSGAAMRYFFNAGGKIEFSGVPSDLSANTKSSDWETLLNSCGTVFIKAVDSGRTGGSGTTSVLSTTSGYHALGVGDTVILRQYSPTTAAGYNLNYATFTARLSAAVGTATVLYVKMTLTDAAPDTSGTPDNVVGNVRMQADAYPPVSTYIPNTWGTVTAAITVNTQS